MCSWNRTANRLRPAQVSIQINNITATHNIAQNKLHCAKQRPQHCRHHADTKVSPHSRDRIGIKKLLFDNNCF